MKRSDNSSLNDLQALFQQLGVQLLRGIKHGHFSYHIEGGGNKNGQRNITLSAGLTHRYQINMDELPSNLTPLATFYPLAQYEPSATLKTSAEDAQVDTEKPHEKGTDSQ